MTYSVRETMLMSSETLPAPGDRTQSEVFAVHGADPEILAFAMAKYSRSSLSMRESLGEISSQRAGQFLNTFYFQYGHRSIADLAHIAFAIERLSLLAAMVLVDESRWDGQERSTRYQNFLESGWFFPGFGDDSTSAQLYSQTIENLFATYQRVSAAVFDLLRSRVARPETLKPEAYERTLRARAFDVARYLLPLATNTSLGQIVSARTLENQVSRLLSHPAAEVRLLGEKLREAATGPAWNLNAKAAQAFIDKLAAAEEQGLGVRCQGSAEPALKGHEFTRAESTEKGDGALAPEASLAAEAAALFNREVRTAPTLVKYAQPNPYLIETQAELTQAATEILANHPIAAAPLVDLVERTESLEVELAATLLYSASHHPYRQIRDLVSSFSSARVNEIIELGVKHRGRHDEALRAFHSGAALRFDSSWTSVASATCTAIAAARKSSRDSPHSTATKLPAQPTCPPDPKTISTFWPRPASSTTSAPPLNPRTPQPAKSPRRRGDLPRPRSLRTIFCRSLRASARSSRWISPRPSTSRSCARPPPATSATAVSPGRCTRLSSASTPLSPAISELPTSRSRSTSSSGDRKQGARERGSKKAGVS